MACIAGYILAVAALLVLGALVYPSLLDYLPWTLVPLFGMPVGAYFRWRRELSNAAEGLYPVYVRPVRDDGRRWGRWRYYQALSMPGVILGRRWTVQEDRELTVTGIDTPRPVSWVAALLITEGPAAIMRVQTTDGALELRARPEYLHALAAGASLTHATGLPPQ